ncbi:MAG TPA: asparagine--tRNA ligase, partial [Gemmatimonadales bacterium]|nr:asparagine--tRNA ligase [Gemmatimonadales bacterium]
MTAVDIRGLREHVGETVTVRGWVTTTRSSGKIAFVVVRDGSGYVQGVLSKKEVSDSTWSAFGSLTQEASVAMTGQVREEPRSPGGYELAVQALEVLGSSPEYPITPKEHGTTFLFEHRHLWLRTRRQAAVARVRHEVTQAIRDFFFQRDFILVDTPILTGAIGEEAGNLFATDYFDLGKAYLAQTGQLYVEAAAAALGKVYCFGPTFRAEKSKTRRHLTEFWMVEPEVAFADLDDVMALAEDLVVSVVARVLEKRRRELTIIERDISKLEAVQKPFPRISYDDAVKRLQAKGLPIQWGGDFGGPDETTLSEEYDRPVLVHRYPAAIKAFYMKPDPERADLALGVDVIAPEGYGEIIGGGERLADLDLLLQRIKEHDLPQEAFEWYLDLRRYGAVPHGGFG